MRHRKRGQNPVFRKFGAELIVVTVAADSEIVTAVAVEQIIDADFFRRPRKMTDLLPGGIGRNSRMIDRKGAEMNRSAVENKVASADGKLPYAELLRKKAVKLFP